MFSSGEDEVSLTGRHHLQGYSGDVGFVEERLLWLHGEQLGSGAVNRFTLLLQPVRATEKWLSTQEAGIIILFVFLIFLLHFSVGQEREPRRQLPLGVSVCGTCKMKQVA